jgi:uncharacterized protein (DUF2235 family)
MANPKTIIFCADGTWNGVPEDDPQEHSATAADSTTELGEGLVGCSNVYKLFDCLEGDIQQAVSDKKEQEKELKDTGGNILQVAKYIHGVGDDVGVLRKFSEGAFGTGVVARIARGYTYISRKYALGDRIVIVGFSRGAYTARALAGLITTMGLLKPNIANNVDEKYDYAFAAWREYRRVRDPGLLQKAADFLAALAEKRIFVNSVRLADSDFVADSDAKDKTIQAVGVWDTVGSLGIPILKLENLGQAIDLFRFTDEVLSNRVQFGFHAISIDEKRPPFTPTFWKKRENVVQRLFAGAHSDVGGGYQDHGLADITLRWMIENLQQLQNPQHDAGVKFNTQKVNKIQGNPLGLGHRPWAKGGWPLYKINGSLESNDRVLQQQTYDFRVDPSVRDRKQAPKGVPLEECKNPEPYNPKNIDGIPFV